MEKDKFNKPKRLKDVDSVSVSLFLKSLFLALPLCVIGFVYGKVFGGKDGALIGVILGAVASVFASLFAMFISDKVGGLAAFLYKGPKANRSMEEQLEGDLSQVRYHKMNKRFDRAILKVDEVLAKAPAHVEALYLKADVLWEGFNEPVEAKRHLKKILITASKTDSYYIWASSLYKKIVKEEKKRMDDNPNSKTSLIT